MESDENESSNPEGVTAAGVKHALLATLPFALFGLTCILTNLRLTLNPVSVYLIFTIIVLLGLMTGFVLNFPIWAYSYLGWSIVMAWWWMMMPMDTFSGQYNPGAHNQLIGWRSWLILLLAIGTGLLMARSVRSMRQLIRGIGEDWTLLSFMMYTFAAFALVIYDENHHPYLAVFMLGSTLVVFLGAWFYLRNTDRWKKLVSLLSGFVFAYLISYVCYATWDWAVYYGFPKGPSQAWYVTLMNSVVIILFWMAIIFCPAIVGLVQRLSHKNRIA